MWKHLLILNCYKNHEETTLKHKLKSTEIKLQYACLCGKVSSPTLTLSCFNITGILVHTEGSSITQHTYKLQVRINSSVSVTTTIRVQGQASG